MKLKTILFCLSLLGVIVSTAAPAAAICRNLAPGDKYFPRYVRCCDTGDGRSWWVSRAGRRSLWRGSCRRWGIRAFRTDTPGRPGNGFGRVCRRLVPGDRYYGRWVSCCDLRGNRSAWVSRSGRRGVWRGSCRSWGIR